MFVVRLYCVLNFLEITIPCPLGEDYRLFNVNFAGDTLLRTAVSSVATRPEGWEFLLNSADLHLKLLLL